MSVLIYNDKEIEYKVSNVNLAIINSYKIKNKADMKNILYKIMNQESEHKFDVFKRSVKGMVQEWRAHNIIYNLGLFRTHTCTVDLEANQKWIFKIIWKIIGTF